MLRTRRPAAFGSRVAAWPAAACGAARITVGVRDPGTVKRGTIRDYVSGRLVQTTPEALH